jgi:predicted TPR repeat methyltransferase
LPPAEDDLRRVCQALVAEKRLTDALEACKLSTEIHPFNWHSWFNLGLVQRGMGKNQEAFASHQCVNKVDPNNHDAAAIRQRLVELGGDKVPEPPECPVH